METSSSKPFVLHIEDDDGDAYLVVRALAQSPRNVRIGRATDGQEAITLLSEVKSGSFERPEMIILDWKLPIISGLEVLRAIRLDDELKDIPVVVFTSSDVDGDFEDAKTAGCSDYVVKAIDYGQFKQSVEEMCEKYLDRSWTPPSADVALVS